MSPGVSTVMQHEDAHQYPQRLKQAVGLCLDLRLREAVAVVQKQP